ncbi:MAG: AsmA-like C-terminal region-containing protein [Gemmataceae bacterium]|nr:AsmA-like C-terminal region-containing protein [Gemmataceae bacterium]
MILRKWLVRGVVFAIVGGCAAGVVLYERWTNPAAVREQVLAKLNAHFPGAQITLDSARLRLLGGISVSELRLSRRDDADKAELLHIPSAVLYHDKERILEGELALRKVELHRLRLKARRDQDGVWNLSGLTGALESSLPLPTMVVQQGTILVEDRFHGAARLFELTNVTLTLINDPLPVVQIDGTAHADFAGQVKVHGSWRRDTHEVALQIEAEGVPLAGLVNERLAGLCPAGFFEGLRLEGAANVQANVAYAPESESPLSYDVRVQVKKGKVRHPQAPLPLEEVEASLICQDGHIRLERLTARSGTAEIEAKGTALLPCIDQDFECNVEIRHLELTEELFARLPDKVRRLHPLFLPKGQGNLRISCARRAGRWQPLRTGAPSRITLYPDNLAVTYVKFPYPVQRVTGTVDLDLLTQRVEVEATVHAGARPVLVKGTWQGEGSEVAARFDIQGQEIPLDETLLAALPPHFEKWARSFHAAGKADVKAHLRHEPGAKEFHCEYHLRFADTAVKWDNFKYPLENVSGYLDIYPKHYELRDFRGTHAGAEVFVTGQASIQDGALDQTPGLTLAITGRNVPLDDDLGQALAAMPQLAKAWETFQPTGRMHFTATIHRPTADPKDLDVELDVRGGAIEPTFFRLPLDNFAAQFHYHNHRLVVRGASARHGKTRLTLDEAIVDMHPDGGFYADLKELQAEHVVVHDALRQALPSGLQRMADALELRDPFQLKTRVVLAHNPRAGIPPDIYWDGQLWLQKARFRTGVEWSDVSGTLAMVGRHNGRHIAGLSGNLLFERATLFKQPFQNVQAKFQIHEQHPDVLLLGIKGPVFGGDISGQARVEFNSAMRYEVNLTASQIELAQFGRHNVGASTQLQGIVVGRLNLSGQGSSIDTLDGNGSIDVPAGKLYNLPLLLDIIKFLGLRWPDRTAFEELHALFAIRGRRVALRKLELFGNAVSLTGKGEVNLDGTDLAVDLYPSWARVEQLLPPAVRSVPPQITKNLLTIEMRGQIGARPDDLRLTKKPMPILIDPLLQMRDRMTGVPAWKRRDDNKTAIAGP